MRAFFERNRADLLIISVITFFYVLPLIIANVYYTDDMARITSGGTWMHDGRIFSTALAELLSFNKIITSLYPYSIILAGLITAITGSLISRILDLDKKVFIFTSLLLLISPFYLENLAYRFDSLYMSLSLFFAVYPLLYWRTNKFVFVSIISLVLVLGFYQTTLMLYMAVILLVQIRLTLKNESIQWRLILFGVLSVLIAYFVYQQLLKGLNLNIARNSFLEFTPESLIIIKKRVISYIKVFKNLFVHSNYIFALALISVLALLGAYASFAKSLTARNLCFKLLIISGCLIGIVFSIVLPNLILETMWLTARTLIVFPVILFLCAIFINELLHTTRAIRFIRYSVIGGYSILIIYSFMLSSVFGTILTNNRDYHDFLAREITTSILREEKNSSDAIELVIAGSAPKAFRSNSLYKQYPVMELLAPNYLIQGWYWGYKSLSPYYNFRWAHDRDKLINNRCNYELVEDSRVYTLWKAAPNKYIIDFYKNC